MISTAAFDVTLTPDPMTDAPSVSVITPAYNPGASLGVTAQSLAAQTLRDFEWILVDDASERRGAETIARAAAQRPATVLRHRVNQGQGQARNTGIAQARAHQIKFLDAGDALDPRHLETLLEAQQAVADDETLWFAPTRHISVETGRSVDNLSYEGLALERETQLARMLQAPFASHCGALWPKAVLEALGGYEPSLATDEDGDLLLRAMLEGRVFRPAPEIRYLYRHVAGERRVSEDDRRNKIASRRRVGERVVAWYESRGETPSPMVRAALCRRFDALAVRVASRWPAEAAALFDAACALDPDYRWSGSAIERAIRRLAGVRAAHRVVEALRAIRRKASRS